jgi:hypothetical protein
VKTRNDRAVRRAGFRGYLYCDHEDDVEGCPTPFACSEAGDCIPQVNRRIHEGGDPPWWLPDSPLDTPD